MKTLMYSADFFAEEAEEELEERLAKEQKKAEKKAERLKSQGKEEEAGKVLEKAAMEAARERENVQGRTAKNAKSEDKKEDNSLMMGLTVAFSLVISVALFMMLPYFLSRQRTFMYHGAEHKCINCIEHGLELNVENVRKSSKEHKRCGTSFLLIVMVVSVIFFLFIRVSSPLWRIVIRLLLLPVIAGVSYEFIRLAGKYDNRMVDILSKPGLCLQGLTTKEPDDSMIEVGIASVEAVFDWKRYLNENFGTHYELEES